MDPLKPLSLTAADIKIEIRDLTMAYGSFVVMRDISAQIKRGEIFIIMGGSGCGKSTLLRHMIGLKQPAKGDIFYDGTPFWQSDDEARQEKLRSFGVLFQSGALWSSMTLAENIGLVLGEYTDFSPAEIREIARLKLALVGLERLRGLLPGGDFRRHVQARRPGPRPGAGPGRAVLRRALGRPGPDQLAQPGRADPAAPRQPRARRSWSSPTSWPASSPSPTTRCSWTPTPAPCGPRAIRANC